MGRFTRIPENTFNALQMDAGILLNIFDPTGATPVADVDIICATTGGINVACVPEYSDLGEDVDNCPNNMKELKHLDSWTCTMSCTSLGTSVDAIKLSLGAADIDNETKIVPRKDLEQTDFADLWWVGDKADGGFVAVRLINALSTGGFTLQTTKNGKGQIEMELTGHVSLSDQTVMPMEFYSIDGDGAASPEIYLNTHAITLTVGETATLKARVKPTGETVTWNSSATGKASVTSGGVVSAVEAGSTIITASITVDTVSYTDTCTVVVVAAT